MLTCRGSQVFQDHAPDTIPVSRRDALVVHPIASDDSCAVQALACDIQDISRLSKAGTREADGKEVERCYFAAGPFSFVEA